MTHQDYFEAVLQLRNPTLQAEEYLLKSLAEEISRAEKVNNGVDYYISDKKKAKKVGRQMRDRFGGEFKVSPSLYTRDSQTSKEVYRLSVLVRIPEFQKGDVVKVNDKIVRITGLGKKVTGDNLDTGKKEVFDYDESFEMLEVKESRVVQVNPKLKVLHPENYQATNLQNEPDRDFEVDEEIKVVAPNGVYIV